MIGLITETWRVPRSRAEGPKVASYLARWSTGLSQSGIDIASHIAAGQFLPGNPAHIFLATLPFVKEITSNFF